MGDANGDAIARAIKSVDTALLAAEREDAPTVTVSTAALLLVMRWTATLARREYQRTGTLPRSTVAEDHTP